MTVTVTAAEQTSSEAEGYWAATAAMREAATMEKRILMVDGLLKGVGECKKMGIKRDKRRVVGSKDCGWTWLAR